MNGPQKRFARLVRLSGISIAMGLLVEALSLIWIHPLAFLSFMIFGGAFFVAGIATFLYALAFVAPSEREEQH